MADLIFKKETHQYFKDNKELISVSKILNNYFESSYDNVPANILKAAANRGNAVHKILELYFKNINKENIIEKLKDLVLKQKTFSEVIKNYCNTALDWVSKSFWNKDQILLSEKMFAYNGIAGTLDLLIKNEQLNLYFINDFKTYKSMTKQLKLKAELQITAYYWLAKNNGYEMANIHFIPWIKEYSVEIIKVEITQEKINEWEQAVHLYKEQHDENR